jgi:flagellar motor protein MotB
MNHTKLPQSTTVRNARDSAACKTSFMTSALSLFALASLASCVSQRQYDDAVALAKYNQTTLHEKEQYIARLESENDNLKRALAMNDVSALSEAGFGEDLQSRLSELQSKIDGLGRPLEDVERFNVTGGYVLMVQDKILFDSGSADLNAEGKKRLAELSSEINSKPHGRIWVRGHTDSDPVSKPQTMARFPHGNLQLSAMRAVEVASQISAADKVAAKDVAVIGFGEFDPIRPNSNSDNKRLNRRVEIFVADRGSAQATPAAAPAPDKKAAPPASDKKPAAPAPEKKAEKH